MLNLDHLQQITGHDNELISSLLQQFIEITEVDLTQLSQAIESHQPIDILNLAHRIKGAAGAIGAIDVEQQAAILEMAARSTSGQFEQLFLQLKSEFESLKSNIELL